MSEEMNLHVRLLTRLRDHVSMGIYAEYTKIL